MGDPLSSLASVITVVGCAAESIQFLLTFFHQFHGAPARIGRWLEMLESLHFTLTSLQECSTSLDPRYRFPPHFCRRLVDCLNQLQACVDEIRTTNVQFVRESPGAKRKWDSKAKRSWERIRWVALGDRRVKEMVVLSNYISLSSRWSYLS